jgi:hypothetical protein
VPGNNSYKGALFGREFDLLHEMLRGLVAQASGSESMLVQFFPLILVSGIVYFLLLRPQQMQQKEH